MNPVALQQYASWLPGRAKRPFLMPEHAVIVAMKDPAVPSSSQAWQPYEIREDEWNDMPSAHDAPWKWRCNKCEKPFPNFEGDDPRKPPPECPNCGQRSDDGMLVAAVSLFPTKGLFLMVEQCATNPEAPARARHAAVEFMFEAVRTYAAITGKLPFMITNKLGLYQLAKKHGWVPHEHAAVLECDPLHPVVPLKRREPRATTRSPLNALP